MKKGITALSLTITILVLALITGVIVYTNSDSIKTVNKTKYAIEILDIQTKIDNYYLEKGTYPTVTEVEFDISKLREEEQEQIAGETITDNKIKLKTIDFTLLGIKKRAFGNSDSGLDMYAVSEITGRVYYLKGFEYNNIKYYTSTNELYNTDVSNKKYKEIKKQDVIFRVNELNTTTSAVKVDVVLPKAATDITITATNSVVVGSETTEKNKKIYSVNTTNMLTNYNITVMYKLNSVQKTVAYSVSNIDSTGPSVMIKVSEKEGYTTITVTATDNENGVSKIKCDKGNLNEEYFDKYGKTLSGDSINCYESGTYTIYAEDGVGNVTLVTQEITVN